MKYDKEPKTIEEHIEILIDRELKISDINRAKKYLGTIGYYRLTGYMYHLQKSDGEHKFKEGTTFNDIITHYQFDKKLRSIINEYLERIEVALRTKLTNYYSLESGFYWYTQYSLYHNKGAFAFINRTITKSFEEPQERFLKSFKAKYTSEVLPPSNMAMEILSMGKLARLYNGLNNDDQKQAIADDFGLPSIVLSSWFIYLSDVRNICAHHGRLWNRKITAKKPKIPNRKKYTFHSELPKGFIDDLYGVVLMINKLLLEINYSNSLIFKITELIDSYPSINTKYMGFPDNWKEQEPWKK